MSSDPVEAEKSVEPSAEAAPAPVSIEAALEHAARTSQPPPAEGGAASSETGAAPDGAGDEGGDDEGGAEAGEGGPVQLGPDGQPLKKRRRRRRGKKKPGEPGAEGATAEGAEGAPGEPREPRAPREPREQRPKRDPQTLPFSRFVGDIASRRGIFAPGEIVAGKVVRVEHGVAVLDLFGKAYAFVAENEPREIAVIAEPEPEEHAETAAADPAVVAEAMSKLDGQVGMPASESLPPPPPDALDGEAPHVPKAPDTGTHPELSDPQAIAQAASALRQVGTPQLDSDGDGVPDDLELAGEGETSHGREEAPAEAETEHPPIELGSIFRGRIAAVADSGHLVLFNRKVVRQEVRQRLQAARADHRRVFGIVYGWNRGGFDVLVEGVRAFCPISGLSLGHVETPDPFIAQRLEFSVQQAKSGQQGIVVSRRGILEREAKKRAREMRKNLAVGQNMKGRVAAVRDFGLIVDLGGIEGLVHLSEVSWDRSKRPGDVASPGDEVEVKIIRLGSPDGERGDRRRDARIGLSIKATQAHPFDEQIGSIEIGSARKAKVMRVTDFGAFVELLPGLEGLLHVSELGRGVEDARQKLKDGDEIVVVVERIDPKARRIGLSMLTGSDVKLFEEGNLPQNTGGQQIRPGATVKARVEKVEPFGIIIQIDGVVGKRGRGFIPNIEMGTDKGTDHRKKFPQGTELEVKIIGVDRDGGLKCSKKALAVDEERKAVQAYRKEAATKGLGTFGDLLKKKLAKQGFTS